MKSKTEKNKKGKPAKPNKAKNTPKKQSKASTPKSDKKPVAKKPATGKKKYKKPYMQIDRGEPVTPKNEFRFNHQAKHTQYLFGETDSQYKALGLTHQKKTFGRKNKKLKENPKAGDTRKSYIRNGVVVDDKRSYKKKPSKNYKFSKSDQKRADRIIRRYQKKEERLRKKIQKIQRKEAKRNKRK